MEKIYFADNLKRLMKKNGMNQKDVAKIAGVSQQTVSIWLSGERIPRMGKIQILANYFGIYKSELIEERNEENEALERELKDAAEPQINPSNAVLGLQGVNLQDLYKSFTKEEKSAFWHGLIEDIYIDYDRNIINIIFCK